MTDNFWANDKAADNDNFWAADEAADDERFVSPDTQASRDQERLQIVRTEFEAAADEPTRAALARELERIQPGASAPGFSAAPKDDFWSADAEAPEAGGGRGFMNPPEAAEPGLLERAGNELGRLRDTFFAGVDQGIAGAKTLRAAAQQHAADLDRQKRAAIESGRMAPSAEFEAAAKARLAGLPGTFASAAEAQAQAQRGAAMVANPATQKVTQAETFGEAWQAFAEAPYDVISTLTAQSMGTMLPALAAAAVAGPATGAVMMGATSATAEAGGALAEFAAESGIDVRDAKALQEFFTDPDVMREGLRRAGTRAGIIGTIDAASGGVAGKVLAPAMKNKAARQLVNVPSQMAVQAGMGGGGEALAQVAESGEITAPGEVVAEIAGEFGGAPAEVAAMGHQARKAVNYTEPDSPSARAGLTPIVVPGASGRAPAAPAEEDAYDRVGSALDALSRATGVQPQDQQRDGVGGDGLLADQPEGRAGGDAAAPQDDDGLGAAAEQPAGGRPAADAALTPDQPSSPVETWKGRSGAGFKTAADAEQSRAGRAQRSPDLDWRSEQGADGRYVVNGYARSVIDTRASEAATSPTNDRPEPTQAQKEAGNYKKGHIRLAGMDIAIENDHGSKRRGRDADGNEWESDVVGHYGYVNGSKGADGDHVDIGIKPGTPEDYSGPVFIIDQVDPKTGEFDEHKVRAGYATAEEAMESYLANYAKGWQGGAGITEMPMAQFKVWVKAGTKRRPLSDLSMRGDTDAAQRDLDQRRPEAAPVAAAAGVAGAPAAPAAVPAATRAGVAPERVAAAVARVQDALLKRGEAAKLTVVEPSGDDATAAAARVAEALGAPIVFVRASGKTRMNAVNADGITMIREGASDAPVALAVHEAVHSMDADVRRKLIDKVMETVTPEQRATFLEDFDTYASQDADTQNEELVAMLAQAESKRPQFWRDLAARLGDGDFKKLADSLISAIDKVVAAFRNQGPEAGRYTSDLKAVRAALVEAYAEQSKRVGGEAQAEPQFSMRERDFADPEERTEVSTTRPRAAKGDADPVTQKWVIDGDDIKASAKHVDAVIRAISEYNTLSGKGDAATKMGELHQVVVDNLLWLHDLVPAAVRQRAKLWYDGANVISDDWAKAYGLAERQTAGVLAVLSPQMDWFKNVSLAERVINVWKNRQNEEWSPAMTAWAESWVAASKTVDEKAARSRVLEDAGRLQGVRMHEMSDADAAKFVRVFDETYHERSYRLVTPEGGYGDYVTTSDDGDASVTWGGFSTIEKALSILNDGSFRNVEAKLGNEHKVRNFYNNIIRPNSGDGHVTIDTHAVAAALLKALSGSAREVTDNFGAAGQNLATGASGTYGLFADAYRDAAAQRGLLPREMQSITWEAVRALFPASIKDQLAPKIDAVWDRFKAGEITRKQARDEVAKISGGIRQMSWEGGDAGTRPADGGTSFNTEIEAKVEDRRARTLEPVDTKDKVAVSLSAATSTIPGIARLYDRAVGGDRYAFALLQDIAVDSIRHLLAGTSARVKAERATGLYGGQVEPSLGLTVVFTDADRKAVLAGLAKFAENFNQEQVHVRGGTKHKAGHQYDDGSYSTPVYRWGLDKALTRKQIQGIIDKSGLYGLTFGDDFVEAYYVGDPANEQAIEQFQAGAERVNVALGKNGATARRETARLWPYGRGDGAIGYDRIAGDVAAGPASESDTARRVAEYLNRVGDEPGRVRSFPQQKDITPAQRELQARIAREYEALPDNDLKNPRVRRAYQELAKEVVRQFQALPIKVEVLNGQGEPYKNSAEMRRDVLDNNHLFIFGTTPDTFGPPGADFSGHPLLEDSGLRDARGYPLLMNDLLRAVHDYFAHTMSPTQFGPKGEEAAWRNHMAMTPNVWARWALTSETRGQNSWVNFRDGAESLPIKDREFARQKAALLPVEYMATGDRAVDAPLKQFVAALPVKQRRGSATGDVRFSDSINADIIEVPGGFDAMLAGKRVGRLRDNLERGQAAQLDEFANVESVTVEPSVRGKGVGAALYRAFADKHDGRILPSGKTTPDAWRLWKRQYPKKVDQFVEMEASRLARGADPALVLRNITDADVAKRVRNAAVEMRALFSDSMSPIGFYSAMARALAGGPGKAMPDQWRAFIKGLTTKGVKAEEIEWSGINEWLDQQTGKVSRDAILEYVNGNGVRVEETVLGDRADVYEEAPGRWRVRGMENSGWFHSREDAETHFNADELRDSGVGTKYGTYVLPGGENYREVLLTLPARQDARNAHAAYLAQLRKKYPGSIAERMSSYTLDERLRLDELVSAMHAADKAPAFVPEKDHWDGRANVLAHIRVNDRRDADGKRVLFVEEIQSDWAQQGKKKGFADPKADAASLAAARKAVSDAESEKERVDSILALHIGGVREATAKVHKLMLDPRRASDLEEARVWLRQQQAKADAALVDARVAADALRDADQAVQKLTSREVRAIPAAPFVGKTDSWVALAVKRVAKMAVDGGYDRVAFVTGEQSAERYDLSKQISSVKYIDNMRSDQPEGRLQAFDHSGKQVIDRDVLDHQLEDFVGKEIASRLLESDPGKTTYRGRTYRARELSGIDLKVGGEGMKAFYDKIVPTVVKDVLRKIGGGAPTTVSIQGSQGWRVVDVEFDIEKASGLPSREAAKEFAMDLAESNDVALSTYAVEQEVGGAELTQPGFEITPKMREIAGEGLPLFSDEPYSRAQNSLMGFRKDKPNKSFAEQKYRHVEFVRVSWDDGRSMLEAQRGLNRPHALERARRNWSDATIEAVPRETAEREDADLVRDVDAMMSGDEPRFAFDLKSIKPATPKPATRATEGWILSRDELGRFRFGAGAKLYRGVAKVANAVLDVVAMKPMSAELRRALRVMKKEVDQAMRATADVAGEMNKLSEADRLMISDIIEKELAAGVRPPAKVLELAATIQALMGRQTDELIAVGMLSQEAADKWRDKYLPRFYAPKLGDKAKDAWEKAVRMMQSKPRALTGIAGNSLRRRGMTEVIEASELEAYQAIGWELDDPYYKPGVSETVQVHRDFTRAEREKMGEIRDAMFRFTMGYMRSQKDLALGRLYAHLAETMASKHELEGYVRVPDTRIDGTDVNSYGKLAGLYVPREVLSHLSKFGESEYEAVLQAYRKALGLWKEGKTALNPVAHMNNVVSNVTMAHFAGVSYWDAHKYAAAVRDFVSGSPRLTEAREAGLFGGTVSQEELMNLLPKEMQLMAQITKGPIEKGVDRVWNMMSLFLRKPMGAAYEAEDLFFRYLIYRDARDRGLHENDAVDYSQRHIFTYDDLPKGARIIRDTALPFFSYTYKVVPVLASTALQYPWRYAAPASLLMAVNTAMYAIAAGDEDDDWMERIKAYVIDKSQRSKAAVVQDEERKNLPPWMKGSGFVLGTPKAIRLGVDDTTQLPLFMDVSRFFPGGDLLDVNTNTGGLPWLQPLTPSSPLLNTLYAMQLNRDPYFGKDVVDANDTSAEAAKKRGQWLWQQFAPALAVNNYIWNRSANAIAQATGKTIPWWPEDYTGIGKDGLPVQPGYAAMQNVGIKVRPVDLDMAAKIEASQRRKMIRDMETEIRSIRRLQSRGALSDESAETKIGTNRDKIRNLRQGLDIEGDERE